MIQMNIIFNSTNSCLKKVIILHKHSYIMYMYMYIMYMYMYMYMIKLN